MIAKVDGLRGNVTKDRLDEGIVWHLHEDQRLSEGIGERAGSQPVLQDHQQQVPDEERTMSMPYPSFPLVSAPASYLPVPVDLVSRLAAFTLTHPNEPDGITTRKS